MKHKTLRLNLHKNKIVNLTIMSALKGGEATNYDISVCNNCHDTVTKDNPNTNNGVPTVGKQPPGAQEPPVLPTYSCDPCV